MQPTALTIRNFAIQDVPQVYHLLTSNRPYVGLNSRYTYFMLARDFADTCLVAVDGDRIVAFSSGYLSPCRPGTFFNWETVVHKDYRCKGLQKTLLMRQLSLSDALYFEGTVNPSNMASKRAFTALAKQLNAPIEICVLFSEADFGGEGHEAEVLYRIGPIRKCAENLAGAVKS